MQALIDRIKLAENWQEVATKAWSMWALYASIAVQAADSLMPYFLDYSSQPWLKAAAFVVTALAAYLRMKPQANLPGEP